ncbi:MAG: hypothetical protein M3P83_07980, partial [Actinomycetota bacterium]|nr:hypothetical protein [Actinomycetota bacterium]
MFDPVAVDAMAPGAALGQALLEVEPADLGGEELVVWLRAAQRQEGWAEARRMQMLARYAEA